MEQSHMQVFREPDDIERALVFLGRALESRQAAYVELVVVGGAALNVLGLGFRPTKDVDVVGLVAAGEEEFCVSARPFPEVLVAAAQDVALALGLPADWLNPGPTDLIECGLPVGFESRVTRRTYGPSLSVLFAGRADLVALKVFAAADQGPQSRHMHDLVALGPSTQELMSAASWARQQDTSEAFAVDLEALMRYLGADARKEDIDA